MRLVIVLLVASLLLCGGAEAFFGFGSKQADKDDLYGVLGVSRRASDGEIKKAFRAIARTDHPDTKQTVEDKEAATARMRDVLRAYSVLGDKEKRGEYDRSGVVPGEQPQGHGGGGPHRRPEGSYPPEFEEFVRRFGGGRGGGFGGGPQRSPISSAAPTITLPVFVERVVAYRGRRINIIHTYSEYSGFSRAFAGVWEQFIRSPLASSAGVSAWRVRTDFHPSMSEGSDSPEEDAAIARYLVAGDLSQASMGAEDYVSTPGFYVVVDGRPWEFAGIGSHLSSPSESAKLVQRLVEFCRSFYGDFAAEITLTSQSQASSFLAQAAAAAAPEGDVAAHKLGRPVHIIMTPLPNHHNGDPSWATDQMIGLAAGIDEAKVHTRFTTDVSLLRNLLVDVCGMRIAEDVRDVVVVVDATKTSQRRRSGGVIPPDAPEWCSKMHVSSSRAQRSVRQRLAVVKESYTSDAVLMSVAFPARIPILRSQNEFILRCVHGSSPNDCVLWVKRDCLKSGVAGFYDPPLWAANGNRLGRATVLLGVCLDRQPRLNSKLGKLLDELRLQMLRVGHQPSTDALILYSHARGEGTAYTMYLNEDLDRGGGLPGLERLLDEFRNHDHVTRIKGAVTDILPMSTPLPSLFVDESAEYASNDIGAITGNANPPAAHFPVSSWKVWMWRAHTAYTALPFNSLIPLVAIYLFMSSCGGLCRRGARRPTNNGPQQRGHNTPPAAAADPNRTAFPTFHLESDLLDGSAPPMLLLLVLHPTGRATEIEAAAEAFKEVTASTLMTDARFRCRQLTRSSNPVAHADVLAHLGVDGTVGNYSLVVVWRKRKAAAVRPRGRNLTAWCSAVADGEVKPTFDLRGNAWAQ